MVAGLHLCFRHGSPSECVVGLLDASRRGARSATCGLGSACERGHHVDDPARRRHCLVLVAGLDVARGPLPCPCRRSSRPCPSRTIPHPPWTGIRSDASKRTVVFGSCRSSIASVRNSLEARLGSAFRLAETLPPRLTRASAHSGLDMYSSTATVAASSENAVTNSPPTSTRCRALFEAGEDERVDVAVRSDGRHLSRRRSRCPGSSPTGTTPGA